jgi:hypothetical protein
LLPLPFVRRPPSRHIQPSRTHRPPDFLCDYPHFP